MEYIIIANPHSGAGMGMKQFNLLIQYFNDHSIAFNPLCWGSVSNYKKNITIS